MIVNIVIPDSIHVTIDTDTEGDYSPDLLDDMCARARDLLRLAITDMAHLEHEHD